ncbi:MAG: hemolysin III family protein, partial [Candidatus Moraniibacteriota bacterium]
MEKESLQPIPALPLTARDLPSPPRGELVSSFTHFVATLFSIAGLTLLIVFAALRGTALHVVAFTIFGSSLLLLYLASTLYHFLSQEHQWKNLFRTLDHSMIYVLIAGTYTPLVLILLPPDWGWSLFGIIWGLAFIGIIKKVFRFSIPGWFSAVFYLLMGWLIVVAYVPLRQALSLESFSWLLAGGIFYTVGTL